MSLLLLFLPGGIPVVTTDLVVSIGATFATAQGTVVSDAGAPILSRGFVVSTHVNPTTSDLSFAVSGTTGSFSANITGLSPNMVYHIRAYATNDEATGYGADFTFITPATTITPTDAIQKKYYYKIYDSSLRYVTTWSLDVISDPTFRTVLNGGAGQLVVKLARPYDNYGEGSDVALQNRVELWVADQDNINNNIVDNTFWDQASWDVDVWDNNIKSFAKLYSGFISAYSPVIDGEDQYIEVTVLGFVAETAYRILKDNVGNTTLTYTNQDPSAILKDIINKYRADGGVNLNYIGNSIQMTGVSVTYTFTFNTLQECFNKIIEMTPTGWFWFVDPNGVVYMEQASTSADHILTIGKEISYFRTNKRIENLANKVYVTGAGSPQLFNSYAHQSSISTYGTFEVKLQDGQITDNATSDLMAKNYLNKNDTPETRTVIRIADNNGENRNQGANIENFKVGDTIQIKNLNYGAKSISLWDQAVWNSDVWDQTLRFSSASILTIVSITYNPDFIEIEASSRLPEVPRRIEQINKKLDTSIQQTLPTAPSVRTA